VCCSVLQCVAVCCSVLQCVVVVCCSPIPPPRSTPLREFPPCPTWRAHLARAPHRQLLLSFSLLLHYHYHHYPSPPPSRALCSDYTDNTATHCNTLRHTVTHCNALQHIATHCNTHYNAQQRTATHCNAL